MKRTCEAASGFTRRKRHKFFRRFLKSPFVCHTLFALALTICVLSAGTVGDAQDRGGVPGKPSFAPRVIYVADFILDVQGGDKGIHGPLQVRKRLRSMVDQSQETPEEKAKRITGDLSRSIVSGLSEKGIDARLFSEQRGPSSGTWLLEGEFVEFDEGDRLKRAVIGFGSGSADMEVRVKLSEVMEGGSRPLFDSTLEGRKNRMPGAVVTKNPYVAGAKYVLTKNAPERQVKKLGSQIADTLYDYMKQEGLVKQ